MTVLQNSQGKIFYGLHMYPGVAQYRTPERNLMVFINEDTIREMDPTFAGRPVFVMHVDGVERNVDKLRNEADGWVFKSFYNEPDGKHWVEFLVCSELGIRAIESQGMRLSNCYKSKGMGPSGKWNGIDYEAQIMKGEYEHLALVPNPRYEESVILTPEEFKAYNERKREELKRLSNEGDPRMKLPKFLNRSEVKEADAKALAVTVVALKSGREITIEQLVNERDEMDEKAKTEMADEGHHVQVGEEKMKVGELKKKYQDMYNELTELRAKHAPGGGDGDGDADDKKKNALEAAAAAKKLADAEAEVAKLKNEADARAKKDKIEADRAKAEADKLRNAGPGKEEPVVVIDLPQDQVERGRQRYG